MEYKNSLINLKYNIIQAPMAGGILNPLLVATVCNSGMLGSIPAGYLGLKALQKFIKEVKNLTKNPFMVNLFIESPRNAETTFTKSNTIIAIEQKLGGSTSNKTFIIPPTISEEDYIELLIKEKVPMVSTTFGFLSKPSVERLKENNIKIIGTATNYKEFTYLVNNHADAVILQGKEAGGHQGSFLSDAKNENTTLTLLQLVRKQNKNAVLIVAGGVSVNNMEEFFKAGANYIQLGTAFMMAEESNLPYNIKVYIAANIHTEVNKNITGKYARGVKNELMKAFDKCNTNEIYGFPTQHYHTSQLRGLAKQNLNPEYLSLWVGSNQGNLKVQPLNSLILSLQNKYKQISINNNKQCED